MITVENKGQFHTSNYTIEVHSITNENSNSIDSIPYNPEFTDDGVSKEQVKGKREEVYKDLTDLPLIDKATYDKLEEQIKSTKINHLILMGRK
jgi:hypothetical protein